MAKPTEVYINQAKVKILALPEEAFGYGKKFNVGDTIECDVVEFRATSHNGNEPEEIYTEYRYVNDPEFYFLPEEVEIITTNNNSEREQA